MAPVKVGDYVRVSDRESTSADAKSGLFYNHFKNMTGTIERVYDDQSVCIDVDIDSLSDSIRDRHIEIQTMQRDKWIAGLSQEQRNKLTEQDKQFKMNYKIVVASSDVQPAKKGSKPKDEAKTQSKADTVVKAEEKPDAAKKPKAEAKGGSKEQTDAAKRLTEEELSAAEEAFLRSRESNNGK